MKKIITLFCLMLSLFAQAQQNGVVEYMYIHRNNGLVDSVAVAEIESVTFATPTVRTQYEAVDLGLSVKWATFNVGATKPEEYGGYYAWGETEEKEDYSWSTYKWCNGDAYSMTKYCTSTSYGTVDNKTTLEPEDDVAHVKWGGSWRMATSDEQKELVNNCTWTWTTLNGVNGYTVTGPNGNSIFLPAAGSRGGTTLYSGGDYWSSSLHDGGSCNAYEFYLRSSYYYWSDYGRCNGFSVRPVCSEAIAPVVNYTVSVSSDENGAVTIDGADGDSATVADGATVTVTATANDGYEFIGWFVGDAETPVSTDIEYVFTVTESVVLVANFKKIVSSLEYEAVDLGLPSGIRWASHNVGATKPEEYGDYYAWGEIEEKEEYSWSTYKWCNGYSFLITKYNTNSMEGAVDGKTTLELEDDVANVKWGGSWRIPTKTEQDELRDNCTWTWTTLNGVNGYIVTGPNGNSIFLPAAGCRTDSSDTGLYRGGSLGYYWSRSLLPGEGNSVYYLLFESSVYEWNQYDRSNGLSVRPVCGTSASPVANVSVSSDGNGVVAINGAYVESVTVVDGSSVTVTVTANDGYEFIGWFVGDNETAVSTDAKYTFTVSEDIVLVAKFERRNKTYINGYEYIDLGLPSGIKWATCNVGATKPEEYGGYYAWGETEEKGNYDWSTYKWCNGTSKTLTKYCRDDYYGTVDNKTTLEPEDDVAHVKWGGSWRMPTEAEEEELRTNCIWTWTAINGVNGCIVTGPNGNCIFLPAAGYRSGANLSSSTNLYSNGSDGYCWVSSLGDGDRAYRLNFRSDTHGWYDENERCYGHNVRPVCRHYTVSVSSDENGAVTIDGADVESATVAEGVTVTVTATANDGYEFIGWFVGDNETVVTRDAEYTFTVSENVVLVAKFKEIVSSSKCEAVDLGLPSGVKWATCNVGATSPERSGGYYAWGETEDKDDYSWSTYKWCNGSYTKITKYCIDSSYGTVDNKTTLDLEDDVAHVKWGGSWRMPTLDEQKELLNNCTWTWTTLNGVDGYNVTGPNGNSIFLPAVGHRSGTSIGGSGGYYWSSSLGNGANKYACNLYLLASNYRWVNSDRCKGFSVRPVCGGNYTVSVSSYENGAVTIDGADVESAIVAGGATVTVTATANDGYEFIGWFVGDNEIVVTRDAEYVFTVSENVVLVAKFKEIVSSLEYEAVDLGLSVKWASFNVGATKPEEYGGYYAWGETEEKENYDWSTYKWCNGDEFSITKYSTSSSYGTVVNPEDDVARVKWGGGWRMPTLDEQKELLNKCTWTWTIFNGVNGYVVTGPNGKSIFLPAAGCRGGAVFSKRGSHGYFWSSSLGDGAIKYACNLYFFDRVYDWNNSIPRSYGLSVRPVCGGAIAPVVNYTVSVSSDENGAVAIYGADGDSATIADGATVTVTATANDGYEFIGWFVGDAQTTISTDAEFTFAVSENVVLVAKFKEIVSSLEYEAVDLGLSVKWATFNVGATKPEEYGGYYAWGETEEKQNYSWSTYKWCNNNYKKMTKYCIDSNYGTVDNKTTLDLEDDVAHVKWGGSWRMPTKAEQDELRNNCTWTWATFNDVSGYTVTGPNGNSIFLPAAGYREGTYLGLCGSRGYYWSSSLHDGGSNKACYLYFISGKYGWSSSLRNYGHSVRPVCE